MDDIKALNCKHCKKTFSQKSSLVRHLKLCTRPKPASLRRKSCHICSTAKAKCDLQRPSCSRCSLRGFDCSYLTAAAEVRPVDDPSPSQEQSTASSSAVTPANLDLAAAEPLEDFLNRVNKPLEIDAHTTSPDVQFIDNLLPDASSHLLGAFQGSTDLTLNDHWYLASLNNPDTTPPLARHSMQVLLRVFRTWPSMLAKGYQYPPIFHHSISECSDRPVAFANCSTLVRMWYGQHEGSSDIVKETISKEMKTIIEKFRTYDEQSLLCALQAVIIYMIMLMFPTKAQIAIPTIEPSLFSGILQLVYHTANTGLVLQEETDHIVPSWESWIHINSKRRAVFSLYLLHWSYSVYHRLQSFNCSELGFMPAPAAGFLWQARSAEQWEYLYKKWLIQWDGDEFMQHEFEHVKPGVMLDERTHMWLEDADELGILFSAIFNTTQREPEFMYSSCATIAIFSEFGL